MTYYIRSNMDLTLGDYVTLEVNHNEFPPYHVHYVDPYDEESIRSAFGDMQRLPISLPPKRRCLLHTSDYIEVPYGYIGLIAIRSTWARLGLKPPQTIADPGFRGHLTLELFNSSEHYIKIASGDKMFTITYLSAMFEPMYMGRYQGQENHITLPKALERG